MTDSLILSELKCKEKQGCLLAGSQGGPAGHLVLHPESFLAGCFFNFVSLLWLCWILTCGDSL